MKRPQSPGGHPPLDLAARHPHRLELATHDDSMLPLRQVPDQPIGMLRLYFTIITAVNLGRIGHPPSLADAV